jgi:hypothetical protein
MHEVNIRFLIRAYMLAYLDVVDFLVDRVGVAAGVVRSTTSDAGSTSGGIRIVGGVMLRPCSGQYRSNGLKVSRCCGLMFWRVLVSSQ